MIELEIGDVVQPDRKTGMVIFWMVDGNPFKNWTSSPWRITDKGVVGDYSLASCFKGSSPHPHSVALTTQDRIAESKPTIHRKGKQIYPEPEPELPVKTVVANLLENCRAFNYTPERTTERLLESLTITRKGGTK